MAVGKKKKADEAGIFDVSASRGLFVGISSFKHPQLTKVAFAVDDAVDLAALFCDLGLLEPKGCVLAVNGDPVKQLSRDRLAALLAAGARRENPSQANLYNQLHQLAMASKPMAS